MDTSLNEKCHRPLAGIVTDGAHSIKNKVTQYRGVDLKNGRELFRESLGNKTVNVGEFLGVIAGIKYIIENKYEPRVIYTDSLTAITWVSNKNSASKKRSLDLKRAEIFLKVMASEIDTIEFVHWSTSKWGEIPADFNLK